MWIHANSLQWCFATSPQTRTLPGRNVVAAWLFNKEEIETYKPRISYLEYFLGGKWGAGHMAPPVLDSCRLPQHALRWLHSKCWRAACGPFSLHSKGTRTCSAGTASQQPLCRPLSPLWQRLELSLGAMAGWGGGFFLRWPTSAPEEGWKLLLKSAIPVFFRLL